MTTNLPRQPDDSILRERIRQAHWGFNLSLAFTSLSAVITVIGVVLFATGQLPQGSYATTLGGLTSTAVGHCCVQLSRDANDRLDRLSREQDEVQEKP